MSVRKTRLVDLDTGERAVRTEIDVSKGVPNRDDVQAIEALLIAASPAGRLKTYLQRLADIDGFPEFDRARQLLDDAADLIERGADFHKIDAAFFQFIALYERAARRKQIRKERRRRSKGGTETAALQKESLAPRNAEIVKRHAALVADGKTEKDARNALAAENRLTPKQIGNILRASRETR